VWLRIDAVVVATPSVRQRVDAVVVANIAPGVGLSVYAAVGVIATLRVRQHINATGDVVAALGDHDVSTAVVAGLGLPGMNRSIEGECGGQEQSSRKRTSSLHENVTSG
jgi:hypothetical protein